MMKKLWTGLLLLLLSVGTAAASTLAVVADPTPAVVDDGNGGSLAVTHCAIYVDSAPRIEVPVEPVDANSVRCRYSIMGMAAGIHTISAAHVARTSPAEYQESEKSAPIQIFKIRSGAAEYWYTVKATAMCKTVSGKLKCATW